MNSHELSRTCMHLLCVAGEGSFVFNEHCYHIVKNDLVVIPMPDRVSNLAAHADLQVEWFAADYKFLQNLLPSNNYSIGGSISLYQNPVIKLTDEQSRHLQEDFHRLRDRMVDRQAHVRLQIAKIAPLLRIDSNRRSQRKPEQRNAVVRPLRGPSGRPLKLFFGLLHLFG